MRNHSSISRLTFLFLTFGIELSSFAQATVNYPLLPDTRLRNVNIPSSAQWPRDMIDKQVSSPKSARFSADGRKLYVNSLEGSVTLVYEWPSLKKIKAISHTFNANNQQLFRNGESGYQNYPFYSRPTTGGLNSFSGKPVESELTHQGRFLWVPYYRRSYDEFAQSPSAVAIIDTSKDQIVRVMPTGPIPKYVVASPDGKTVAIMHWGDNTIGIIDTSSSFVEDFEYIAHLTVESQLSQKDLANTDRDTTCGFCLRGAVFTPDSKYLLVARMGKGGLAAFDMNSMEYLGTLMAVPSTPRHLGLSPDGEYLYATSTYSGKLSRIKLQTLLDSFRRALGRTANGPSWQSLDVGPSPRTMEISKDGKRAYVAVNRSSELVVVDLFKFQVISRTPVDNFAVGLAVPPDEDFVVITSQGRPGLGGGNSVGIFKNVSYDQ